LILFYICSRWFRKHATNEWPWKTCHCKNWKVVNECKVRGCITTKPRKNEKELKYIANIHIGNIYWSCTYWCELKHFPSKQFMYIVHNWFHCATSLRISMTTLIHYCQIHYKWIIGHMCLASTYISTDHAQPWHEMGHDNRLKHIYSCLVNAIRHKLEHTNLALDVI